MKALEPPYSGFSCAVERAGLGHTDFSLDQLYQVAASWASQRRPVPANRCWDQNRRGGGHPPS